MTFAEPALSDILSLDEEPVNVGIRTNKVMSKAEEARIEEIAAAMSDDDGDRDVARRRDSVTEEDITEQDGIPMIVVTNAADGTAKLKRQRTTSSSSMDYLQVQSPSLQPTA